VTAEKFDWAAMRFDFGASGQAAVERLAKSGKTPAIKTAAAKALKLENRWSGNPESDVAALKSRIKTLPANVAIPDALSAAIARQDNCQSAKHCLLLYTAGNDEAVQLIQYCEDCAAVTNHYVREGGDWRISSGLNTNLDSPDAQKRRNTAVGKSIDAGKVTVREVKRRQVFVGDEPVGNVFE
jgi:hypothetical protein